MTKRLRKLEQEYNGLIAQRDELDSNIKAGKLDPGNCLYLLFRDQLNKAIARKLDQIKVQKINITLHEQQHGFPLADNNQLAFNFNNI